MCIYIWQRLKNMGVGTGPGGLFATRLVTELGGLATNPPCDKPVEDYSTRHRGPRQGFVKEGGTATNPYFEAVSYIHTYMCMCMHIYIYICTDMYVRTYVHAYIHIYSYRYTYMYTDTYLVTGTNWGSRASPTEEKLQNVLVTLAGLICCLVSQLSEQAALMSAEDVT